MWVKKNKRYFKKRGWKIFQPLLIILYFFSQALPNLLFHNQIVNM